MSNRTIRDRLESVAELIKRSPIEQTEYGIVITIVFGCEITKLYSFTKEEEDIKFAFKDSEEFALAAIEKNAQ